MPDYPDNISKDRATGEFGLWITSFWTGAAVMAFELLGARLLIPSYGMGIEVWATVISISLAALALGYWGGGRIGDARPSVGTLSVVLLVAGFCLLLVRIFGRSAASLFESMSPAAGAFLSSVIILTGPLLLLGMVQPILARLLLRSTTKTGTVVGALLGIGTAGSVVGTLAAGLFFIPRMGVAVTLLLVAVGTFLCALMVLTCARRWKTVVAALALAVASLCAIWNFEFRPKEIGPMKKLEEVEGLYGHLEVLEYRGSRALLCNGIFQTLIPESNFGIVRGTLIRGRDYIELIPYLRRKAKTALIIGLGGGLYDQMLSQYGFETYGVEIEPAMAALAVKYFSIAAKVTVTDGRRFLLQEKRTYDVIILDAFIGGSVPEHLYTIEAFELTKARLNPGGILAVHLIGYPKHAAIEAVTGTTKATFGHVLAVRSGHEEELQHVFVFASDKPVELGPVELMQLAEYGFTPKQFCEIETDQASILTDDKSGLTMLYRDIVAEHRKYSLKVRRKPLW